MVITPAQQSLIISVCCRATQGGPRHVACRCHRCYHANLRQCKHSLMLIYTKSDFALSLQFTELFVHYNELNAKTRPEIGRVNSPLWKRTAHTSQRSTMLLPLALLPDANVLNFISCNQTLGYKPWVISTKSGT